MSKRKKHYGTCVICGKQTELTYEHIPPQASGNNSAVKTVTGDVVLKSVKDSHQMPWNLSGLKYQSKQRGYGEYSLCASCNNLTGDWYAKDYVALVLALGSLMLKQKPAIGNNCIVQTKMRPLNFLKQLCAMAMTVDQGAHSADFREFILDPNNKLFPHTYSIYLYLYVPGLNKYLGESVIGNNLGSSNYYANHLICEMDTQTFGFMIYKGDHGSDIHGLELSNFATYDFNQVADVEMILPILSSFIMFPNDFRSKLQIAATSATSKLRAERRFKTF